jgi:hypothetical protein
MSGWGSFPEVAVSSAYVGFGPDISFSPDNRHWTTCSAISAECPQAAVLAAVCRFRSPPDSRPLLRPLAARVDNIAPRCVLYRIGTLCRTRLR